MAKTLGIDVGTTTISALIFDTASRTVLRQASRPSNAFLRTDDKSVRAQDCEILLSSLYAVLADLLDIGTTYLDVDGLSVTGQMHGFLLLDAEKRPLTPFFTWRDKSTLATAPSGLTWIEEFQRLEAKTPIGERGVASAPGYMGPACCKMLREGTLPAKTAHAAMIHDWIASELMGRPSGAVFTDPSFAQSSGLFKAGAKKWNEPLLREIGLETALLSRVVESGTLIGKTAKTPFPLRSGIPLFAGLGDNQASFLGGVGDWDNSLLLNVGTGGQVSAAVETFTAVEGLETRIFPEGKFLLAGASLSAGRAYGLLKEFVRDIGIRIFDRELDEAIILERLDNLTADDTDLECIGTFAGTRGDPGVRGGFTNISESNFDIGRMACALLSGIAVELRGLYEKMGLQRELLVGSGNGLRRNRRLQAAVEAVFASKLRLPAVEEEAAFGAALCAAVGLKAFPSFRDAGRVMEYPET